MMVEALSSAFTAPRDMIIPAASLRDPSSPVITQCVHYCQKRRPAPLLPTADATSFSSASRSRSRCFWMAFPCLQIHSFRSSRPGIRCQAMTETEPEGSDEKENDVSRDGASPPSVDGQVQNDGHFEPEFNIVKKKDEVGSKGLLDLGGILEKSEEDLVIQNGNQEKTDDLEVAGTDDLEIASGSPLPGMKQQLGQSVRIPKAIIDILKDQVFGFDTFFVTSQEPYEGGVLFKGNLRGKAAKSYEKITKRMQDRFGDEYKLFLLINPEDDKPVAVVVPRQTLQPETTAVLEWFAAGAFGLVTVFTLLLRNVSALQANLLSTFDNLALLRDGLPGALVTALVLGFHEIGHILIARDTRIKLGVPYFVPSWQIGSFGAITRIASIIDNREDLIKLAAAGPLAGFSMGFFLLLLGFILPPADGIGIVVDPAVFHESFLAGGIAKLILGEVLREGSPLSINPLVLWAWAGLLINAINSIPAGELDGGRISFAIWGRKASARLTGVTLAILGISSLFNDVAFYWAVLIFFLQRGPIAPLSEEVTEPENKYTILGVAVLLFGLLVCLPYPFPFTNEGMNLEF